MDTKQVDVLIVGGGPAGLVAACLLARAGTTVLVAERNEDFSREFRGEVLQPRFHQAMRDVGLFECLERCAHERIEAAHVYFEGKKLGAIRLDALDPSGDSAWWMTQPELLRGLDAAARGYAGYELWFKAKIVGLQAGLALLERDGQKVEVRAKVVVGADGRFSALRRLAAFATDYDHHDVDLLWFTLPRPAGYEHVFGFFLGLRHSFLILPKYPDLLQCGLILAPDEAPRLQQAGIGALKEELLRAHPVFADFAAKLTDLSAFHPLKGTRALVREWAQDGVVLIGDAAHTCSPVGGIGVAIAAESACVAAAVILDCLKRGDFSRQALGRIQRLRQAQVRSVHRLQSRARFLVRAPAWAKRLIPLALGAADRLGLFPFFARRLLTQQGRLGLDL